MSLTSQNFEMSFRFVQIRKLFQPETEEPTIPNPVAIFNSLKTLTTQLFAQRSRILDIAS